mgnify:FL=1|tara:strand:+ start:699 stop:1106 length:408 start_codon:yes stop_codon:yes gene_type:complete
MIISTCEYNDKSYNILGVVDSIKTRVFGLRKDLIAGVGELVGYDLGKTDKAYEKLKNEAINDLKIQTEKLKGNGIIGLKFNLSQLQSFNSSGILVLTAYGTAIKFNKNNTKKNKKSKMPKKSKKNKKLKKTILSK